MVGVGGTTLSLNGYGLTYDFETTWISGGGGISNVWPIPDFQVDSNPGFNGGSDEMRNVPDVSANADPATPYSIYFNGDFTVVGGTSAAAPLWAAFYGAVNQRRGILGQPVLGFPSPQLYALSRSSRYNDDFHDIADFSDNTDGAPVKIPPYLAQQGYDNTTGIGSMNGMGLLADLTRDTIRFDLDGDKKNDLLLQNSKNGSVVHWLMQDYTIFSNGYTWKGTDPNWKVVGNADINHDGMPDILLQYQGNGGIASGTVAYWQMDGTKINKNGIVWNANTPGWRVVGVSPSVPDATTVVLLQKRLDRQVHLLEARQRLRYQEQRHSLADCVA